MEEVLVRVVRAEFEAQRAGAVDGLVRHPPQEVVALVVAQDVPAVGLLVIGLQLRAEPHHAAVNALRDSGESYVVFASKIAKLAGYPQ